MSPLTYEVIGLGEHFLWKGEHNPEAGEHEPSGPWAGVLLLRASRHASEYLS